MKRTSFKKMSFEEAKLKLRKPLQRAKKVSKLKGNKPKVVTITKLKKQLWKEVSDFIRDRDGYVCFTSGVKVTGSNAHCGHMYPSSVGGVLLRYHPYNLACQSYVENIHHSGNGAVFYQKAVEKYGTEEMDKLKYLKNCSAQGDRQFYSNLIELYKEGDEKEIVKYLNGFA